MIMIQNSSSNSSSDPPKLDEVIIGEGGQPGRKGSKFSLHSLSSVLVDSKLTAGLIPHAISHEEAEIVRLTKLMKSNSLTRSRKQVVDSNNNNNILKRIIPQYKPNSKVKGGVGLVDNNKIKINHAQLLRPCQSESDNTPSSLLMDTTRSIGGGGGGGSTGSCMKISISLTMTPKNTITGHNVISKTMNKNKFNRQNPINSNTSKGRMRKVRFDKKLTIHYVPADEERGSFEWRKNLTRQGIYQAMLWKSELEKLDLEETLSSSNSVCCN